MPSRTEALAVSSAYPLQRIPKLKQKNIVPFFWNYFTIGGREYLAQYRTCAKNAPFAYLSYYIVKSNM